MIKKLTKHGNSHALVIEKPVLDLLGFTPDTPLEITTDGNCLLISRARDKKSEKAFRAALANANRKFGRALQRLAN